MNAELDDFGDAIANLRRATHSATKVAADTLEAGTIPTDADLDRMIVEATNLSAAAVAGAMDLKHLLSQRRETWVRADWIAGAYAVTRKWCYNHSKRLGAVSHGHRTLVFPLSVVVAELGPPPEHHLSVI